MRLTLTQKLRVKLRDCNQLFLTHVTQNCVKHFCFSFLKILNSFSVYTHPGPSGGYPDPMSYMMEGNQMMHRPPGDPAFHQGYHYPPAEYYPHHL
jgi:hypothetical protein